MGKAKIRPYIKLKPLNGFLRNLAQLFTSSVQEICLRIKFGDSRVSGAFWGNHRLNGPELTATPRSYGKGQISTTYKIKTPETPERIGMKFGTVDYVLEICLKPNLVAIGSAGVSG